jgi:NADPH-dependent glutamate synthase beta subunit-like oxidoreductase
MDTVKLIIDGQQLEVPSGISILEAARKAAIYIPALCFHPDLPPAKDGRAIHAIFQGNRKVENASAQEAGKGCGLCLVEIQGQDELVESCAKAAEEGMVVITENDRIRAGRRKNLVPIMSRHPHACLTCAQQQGCPRSQCSTNVPENERCCPNFGHCELQNVASYIGILDTTPKWAPTDLPVLKDHPLFERDYNLCIGCTRCVRVCRDFRGIEALGFVYDEKGLVQIGTIAETLEGSGCKFCTACVEVCPTGALVDKAVEPGTKAEDIVPCKAACPVHIDIPGYLRMIAQGKVGAAAAIIREKVPFPGVLGRVCIHPCEPVCRRGAINEPISICALKRFAADRDQAQWRKKNKIETDTGKKVAVVGAGPAGLTAAFYLRKRGHTVTIFDKNRKPGGMMRYGIPEYRLPRDILDREIENILDLGIDFKPNKAVGKDVSLDDLNNSGYDAVFLGIGAQLGKRIALQGCNLADVTSGVDFLRSVCEGKKIKMKDRVVVIGGGNAAVDAAMTALRCGATDVKMACLESVDEMPASPRRLAEAKAEGIGILPSCGPDRIVSKGGKIAGMDLVVCTRVFDENGNFCPEFSDIKECIPTDQIIMAVGQAVDTFFLDDFSRVKIDNGLIVVEQETFETAMEGVYAGGDVSMASGSIIHAIAAGRQAAAAIDKNLGGSGEIDEVLFVRGNPNPNMGRDQGFAELARVKIPQLDAATRSSSFLEIYQGFDDDQAVLEARRCLQCDLRLQLGCNPPPPEDGFPLDEDHVCPIPETEGVFQLLDTDGNILAIKGTANLKQDLRTAREENKDATHFKYEEDKMYSQRESELIQKYIREHGEMPGAGADDIDDLV